MNINDLYDKPEASAATPAHSTKDYKMLFLFLLSKFKTADREAANQIDTQTHTEKLIKFLEMRNAMLVDLLRYIDRTEELEPVGPVSDERTAKSVQETVKAEPALESILAPLLESPDSELLKDPQALRDAIKKLAPSSQHAPDLNYQLYVREHSNLPDQYSEADYQDLFARVKRNSIYSHNTLQYYSDPRLPEEFTPDSPDTVDASEVPDSLPQSPTPDGAWESSGDDSQPKMVVVRFSPETRLRFKMIVKKDE